MSSRYVFNQGKKCFILAKTFNEKPQNKDVQISVSSQIFHRGLRGWAGTNQSIFLNIILIPVTKYISGIKI